MFVLLTTMDQITVVGPSVVYGVCFAQIMIINCMCMLLKSIGTLLLYGWAIRQRTYKFWLLTCGYATYYWAF